METGIKELEKWLIKVKNRCHPTGSQLFCESGKDKDYVLPLDVIPPHFQEILTETYGDGEYGPEFFNVKVDPGDGTKVLDFVITKTREEFNAWKWASKMALEYVEERTGVGDLPHLVRMRTDRDFRAGLFEAFKFVHRQSDAFLDAVAETFDAKEVAND